MCHDLHSLHCSLLQAADYNKEGKTKEAEILGHLALACGIVVLVITSAYYYSAPLIGIVAFLILYGSHRIESGSWAQKLGYRILASDIVDIF